MRVDVMDVAKDVTTASLKRWNPSDKSWTNAALADRANTPQGLGSRDELDPHYPHSLPVGSPAPAHNNLPPVDLDLNYPPLPNLGSTDSDNSHPLPLESPQPAHKSSQLDADLHAIPQPPSSLSDNLNSHPLQAPPAHHNLLDLNASPQQTQETDSYHSGSYYSANYEDSASSRAHISGAHTTDSGTSSDVTYYSDVTWHGMKDIPGPSRGNLDLDLNKPLPSPGPTDGQPPPAPASDPGSLKRPYRESSLDSVTSKRPYRPSDPGPSSWADLPSYPEPSIPPSPSPGPQQHESETFLGDILKSGRLKRHVSGSGSLNAAKGVAGYP